MNLRLNSRDIVIAALFGALYAIGVAALAPFAFSVFQVRLADMLLPLTILFGWPAIVGITAGTFLGNFFGPYTIIDAVGGSLANLIGCTLAFFAARRFKQGSPYKGFLVGGWIITLVVTFIVGTYLFIYFPEFVPAFFGLPLITVAWLGIFIGSVIAINIGGTLLVTAIYNRGLHSPEIRRLLKL